jgi:uncharacterized protein with PIN domain
MPRFVCDAMLGSLARWLRFFGYDCAFHSDLDDHELAELASREDRWLLTCDRELAAAGPRTSLIRAVDLDGQLVEVLVRHGLQPIASLDSARCGQCNGELRPADKDEVVQRVPPYVARTGERFRVCDGCGRVYWPGTHARRIVARMERVCAELDRLS